MPNPINPNSTHPCVDANYYKGQSNQRRMLLVPSVQGGKSPYMSKQNWDTYPVEGRIRRLMPVECERLMSWPDNWTKNADYGNGPKEVSDTQRYKMCGNGVVSEVVAAVVKELFQ